MKSPKDQTTIQIEITNACIHNCSNCTRLCGHHQKPFFMDFDTFKRAVESLEGYDGTIGIMGGEPTIHPEFDKFITWLGDNLPEQKKQRNSPFIRPQKDFMGVMHDYEWEQFAPREGIKETVGRIDGAGLWSAMGSKYMEHFELIQDVFRRQVLNDHNNTMFHQPILISRKELGIDDATWISLREKCWINQQWSGSINPKGCFFCEIAATLDMVFDGPGGWPIEKGWWKREGRKLEEQTHWCEYCGIPLLTFTRDANEEVDDVSPMLYEKLKAAGSPKVGTSHINVLKINNNKIAEESKAAFGIHEEKYAAYYEDRFNIKKTVLYPKKVIGIQVSHIGEPTQDGIGIFDDNYIVTDQETDCGKNLGVQLYKIFKKYSWKEWFVIYSGQIELSEELLSEIKQMVWNPGTLVYLDLTNDITENKYIQNKTDLNGGFIAVLNTNASSLKAFGTDRLLRVKDFKEILNVWDSKKVVLFSDHMGDMTPNLEISPNKKYAVFGTGFWIEQFLKDNRIQLVCAVDSDEGKWNTDFHGVVIEKPEVLMSKRKEYDEVIIGSHAYYSEIKQTLLGMGFQLNEITII